MSSDPGFHVSCSNRDRENEGLTIANDDRCGMYCRFLLDGFPMPTRFLLSALTITLLSGATAPAAFAADRDAEFFKSVEGQWSGPGEIVAGKYKGTKFVCNFMGATPDHKVGMSLDGSCRVGVFSQEMSANIEREGGSYKGRFMDGAQGKGLDVVSGDIEGRRVVFALNRKKLNGAFLAHLTDTDKMRVTVSVRVDKQLVPVIGMDLVRVGNGDQHIARQ